MSVIKPQPFCYTHAIQTAIGAGATVIPNIVIGNDADFYLTEIRGAYTKVAAWTTGGLQIQISLQQGELFSNGVIQGLAFLQGNQLPEHSEPIRFNDPIKIPRNSQLSVQITNSDAAVVASVQVQFWGYKAEGYQS